MNHPVPTRTTERLTSSPQDITRAAEILRNGGTVAFPTETVYGLGANALDAAAVERIFLAKDRPHWDPLIVHVSNRTMLDEVATVSAQAELLIEAFWPGPLTLLLPRTEKISDAVTAGRSLVGVRMPAHPLAHALIEAAGLPLAAPSANRFGRISPTTAAHVLQDLDHRIDAVLDGGATTVGVESTVLDPNQSPMILYRPGAITPAMLEPIAGPVTIYQPPHQTPSEPQSQPSPGVGIRHYAPRARLILVDSEADLKSQLAATHATTKDRIGVMLPQGWTITTTSLEVFPWNSIEDPTALAQTLFVGLRELDSRGVAIILCPMPKPEGLGLAIRDRLKKAARAK
ncbi:L-threonylcarbamoyladenylate synthase [Tunturiibacter gelidoferens]|uniref:Threonylcarbamoyl-AMP synthase n=2 Tax=Tunturiibacter TaxID=3154218 RepID=A0A7Y9NMN5_9BACT|nr:L-threonylcarbamoyladenylate synthase [Edaphobacter lichenicola]MBB5338744.1 L-threonylcarbamoyladenylate synthase [Edaphobacter lichenicola]NYF52007.1 L-threonylcarbamoyladenylate synthase [Edaphobacter lichenicola]